MDWVIRPAGPAVPVLACLPHGGTEYLAELAGGLARDISADPPAGPAQFRRPATRPEVLGRVSGAFKASGFDVRHKERFAGGWTVRRFQGRDDIDAIGVELNQHRYLAFSGHR